MLNYRKPSLETATELNMQAEIKHLTLADLEGRLTDMAVALGHEVECFQSNSEGAIIDFIQRNWQQASGIIINPGGGTNGGNGKNGPANGDPSTQKLDAAIEGERKAALRGYFDEKGLVASRPAGDSAAARFLRIRSSKR